MVETLLTREEHAALKAARAAAAAPRRSESRQRTAMVALRLLPAERDHLSAAARDRQVSVSELIRASVLGATGFGARR